MHGLRKIDNTVMPRRNANFVFFVALGINPRLDDFEDEQAPVFVLSECDIGIRRQ